jgi:hypothetical protein
LSIARIILFSNNGIIILAFPSYKKVIYSISSF